MKSRPRVGSKPFPSELCWKFPRSHLTHPPSGLLRNPEPADFKDYRIGRRSGRRASVSSVRASETLAANRIATAMLPGGSHPTLWLNTAVRATWHGKLTRFASGKSLAGGRQPARHASRVPAESHCRHLLKGSQMKIPATQTPKPTRVAHATNSCRQAIAPTEGERAHSEWRFRKSSRRLTVSRGRLPRRTGW